jgi:hypothetical protein
MSTTLGPKEAVSSVIAMTKTPVQLFFFVGVLFPHLQVRLLHLESISSVLAL